MSLLEYLKHFREKNNDKDFIKVKKSKKEENEEIENEEENDENEDEEDNEEDEKDNEDESTIDDPIANISKLDGLKRLNDNISYKLAF